MTRYFAFALLAVLAAAAVATAFLRRGDEIDRLFGGTVGRETVLRPERVTAFRLKPILNDQVLPLDDYPIVAGPIEVPRESGDSIGSILVSHDSYSRDDWLKACIPVYGVRLSFARGDDTVDVLLCLECELLATYLNGKSVSGDDFEPACNQLLSLVKQLFPNDEQIQSLKPRSLAGRE